jgi:hypothetical protein
MHASTFLVIALIAISFPAMALLLALGLCKAAKTALNMPDHFRR